MAASSLSVNQAKVVQFIEHTMQSILEQMEIRPYGKPSITLQRVVSMVPTYHQRSEITWSIQSREVNYAWPGASEGEAWRYACVGKILSEIYAAILASRVMTKREIYYHDPSLFRRQETVDRYVDDIAFTCGVSREDLNVTASPRGMIAGLRQSGSNVEVVPDDPGLLKDLNLGHINWVLVIEKEATFKTLIEDGFHCNPRLGDGVIVTVPIDIPCAWRSLTDKQGRGYPDLATRRFLRRLVDRCPSKQLLGLFDADPYGVDIFRCYLLGSRALAPEMGYALNSMIWLGMNLDVVATSRSCLRLTGKDRATIRSMLARPEWGAICLSMAQLAHCRQQLLQMLMLNIKAEIEAVEERSEGLSVWLQRLLCDTLSVTAMP